MMKNKYLISSHFAQFANVVLPQNINHCSEGLKLYLVICVLRGSA